MWKHCIFITLFYRAQIERENKDIRLEKIRVKAAEQRETVLQSIKLVVLSVSFTCSLNLPRFSPILIQSYSILFPCFRFSFWTLLFFISLSPILWSWSQFLQASNNSPLGLLTVLFLHLFSSPALQWMSTFVPLSPSQLQPLLSLPISTKSPIQSCITGLVIIKFWPCSP